MELTRNARAGAQISARAFTQSLLILLLLMMLAGILTRVVPAGAYTRQLQDGRAVIVPESFRLTGTAAYPVWRWFTAPFEVLGGPDGVTIITIILFLVMVGAAFAVLDKTGILLAGVGRVVALFGGRKYLLLLAVSLFFMFIGAFLGLFEEVVPLVPLMIALAYYLGWDSLTGLGMSILATNMGFSAAVTNPFTLGVSQKLAGLPLFSGAWLRILIFLAVYAVLAFFLVSHARRVEREPQASPVYAEDRVERAKYGALNLRQLTADSPHFGSAMAWFAACLVLILLALAAGPLLPAISDYSLPLVGILFFAGGMGAGFIAAGRRGGVWRAAADGVIGIAPSIPLILMAASIKQIVSQGGIIDTILHSASLAFAQTSPFVSVVMIYALALLIEFFVASGSAKAFLLMPILLPLADLVGVTRQAAVTAYCFGDGFSNLAYPTNPVLLISLGLTVVSYPRWLRWSLKLWAMVLVVTLVFLGIAVALHFGPF